jgi:beta-galactosidase/beta-glucuronidase
MRPNDKPFLDLCDEQGSLVWEENRARGLELDRMQQALKPLEQTHAQTFV